MTTSARSTSLAAAAALSLALAACGGDDDAGAEAEVAVEDTADQEVEELGEAEADPALDDAPHGEDADEDLVDGTTAEDDAGDGSDEDGGEDPGDEPVVSGLEFDEDNLIEIPDSPLETVDVGEIPGEDLTELVDAAEAAEVSIPMVSDAVAVSSLTTPVSETADFAVEGVDPLDVINAIGRDFAPQGWHATREMTSRTTNDETTHEWEFSTRRHGADYRATLLVFETDEAVIVRLSFFVPNDA